MPGGGGAARAHLGRRVPALALAIVAAACSPPLDWREARLDGGRLAVLFPCRPVETARDATLLARPVRMSLQSCRADGSTFALTHADVGDPALVAPALERLRSALAANLGAAAAAAAVPFRVEGMTPGDRAARLRLRGTLPDGAAVDEQAVTFSRGTHIYQAVVLGDHARGDAADTYFASLRLAR